MPGGWPPAAGELRRKRASAARPAARRASAAARPRVRSARSVMSSRFPSGVATTKRTPAPGEAGVRSAAIDGQPYFGVALTGAEDLPEMGAAGGAVAFAPAGARAAGGGSVVTL